MSAPLVAIGITLLASLFLWRLVRWRVGQRPIRSLDDLNGLTVPVDLEAFQNLIAPAEDAYLRSILSGKLYRKIQRMRTHAILEYLHRVAHNASVLLRLGEATQENAEGEVAEAARRLASMAMAVRINVLMAVLRLYLLLLWPADNRFCSRAITHYSALKDVFGKLGKLENPSLNARVAAAL